MFTDLTPLSPSDQAELSEAHYAIMESVNTVLCHHHHHHHLLSPQSSVLTLTELADQSTYGVLRLGDTLLSSQ